MASCKSKMPKLVETNRNVPAASVAKIQSVQLIRTIRQLEERQLPTEVTLMKWSPKMDLLAIANVKGEVALHRLTWQRVWLLNPPDEFETVSNLSWRPDGKLLAVCYENSRALYLIDIENKNILHKKDDESKKKISCMAWLPLDIQSHDDISDNLKFTTSPTGNFLPPLPSLNRGFSHEPERKDFLFQTLDILFLGHDNGEVTMYVFGMFYCGTLTLGSGRVLEITGGLGKPIWISCRSDTGISVNKLSCSLLERSGAFLKVAQIQANIECLMDYLSQTLMAISEAWETILLEMDEKLARYEESDSPGTLAADFLELLMIGIPSSKLETFLLRDLSDKGLKKLGHSIEICYSNIQKLVLKHLSSVGMALVYQLAEMRGMARLGGPYESLGLKDEEQITKALHASETFLAKSSEIQQVIDHSMRDYKAFFRWLYVVIAKLTDERIPSEASRISQQELTFIAEFLRGFDKTEGDENGRRKGVNLEKLGQYLRRESLQIPLMPEGSEWVSMLTENKCLHDHPLVINQDLDSSLLQSHDKLVRAIEHVFSESYRGLTSHFTIITTCLTPFETSISSQIVSKDGGLLLAASNKQFKLLRLFKIDCESSDNKSLNFKQSIISFENKKASFSKIPTDYTITDLQCYSVDFLSLLLLNQNNFTSYFLQFPLNKSRIFNNGDKYDDEYENIDDIITGPNVPRAFHGISAANIIVSGKRKVAAVLSDNSRKIRLLETEVEPDDEEDDDEDDTCDDNLMETSTNVPESSS